MKPKPATTRRSLAGLPLDITHDELNALEAEYCSRRLINYVRRGWSVVEPAQPFKCGWHIEAICEHLEAVTNGEISRLAIAVPPGSMKSLLTSVFWPSWIWGPRRQTAFRTLATSHSERLAIRDNLRTRRLIQSSWYQRLFPHVVLTGDQNEKRKFENKDTGFREAMPFESLTGSRGDSVVIDDPLSVRGAESPAVRASVEQTFLEAVPTRLNDPERSSIVLIMQRLHERDPIGLCVTKELGYEMLVLPMEFETERRCRTSIGFADPRKHEGELLFPERFPREVVERDKKTMGSYAWAGQAQQRPAPRSGGLFQREWFEIVDAAPAKARRVRGWDFAASIPRPGTDPDWTVGLRMSEAGGTYFIEDVRRFREATAGVERNLLNTTKGDGYLVRIALPQDPGSAGKAYAATLVKLLAGYNVRACTASGDKVVRAKGLSAQAEAGNVKLVRGAWNDTFLDEISMFPNASHDDQVDAASEAFNTLTNVTGYTLDNV